ALECCVVGGGDDGLYFHAAIASHQAIRGISVATPVKETAVAHINKILVFVEHSGHRLLLVTALHMLVTEAVFSLAPCRYFQRNLQRIALGWLPEALCLVSHDAGEVRSRGFARSERH